MADKMPPQLRERFEKKQDEKSEGKGAKEKRMEALEKARKHKMAKGKK